MSLLVVTVPFKGTLLQTLLLILFTIIVIILVLAFTPHLSVKPTTLKNAGNSCSLVKQLSCLAGHMVCHVLCHMIGHMFHHLTMTHHLR